MLKIYLIKLGAENIKIYRREQLNSNVMIYELYDMLKKTLEIYKHDFQVTVAQT